MAAIKKIILHIGIFKTGSTSIQETLQANNRLLAKAGYIFPSKWGPNHSTIIHNLAVPDAFNYYYNITHSYVTREAIAARNRKHTQSLQKALKASDGECLIISGEELSTLDAAALERLKAYLKLHCGRDAQIEVFAYVRNPANYLDSIYQQYILSPSKGFSAAQYIENHAKGGFFKAYLHDFLTAFDKKSVHIYRFEDAINHKQGLVGHFLEHIGLTEEQIGRFAMQRSNEARCAEAVEFLEYIESREPLNGAVATERVNPKRIYGDWYPLLGLKGAKFGLTAEQKRRLLDLCQSDIQWLKDACGIDYTNAGVPEDNPRELYSNANLEEFLRVFPRLTYTLQGLFLDFFHDKYQQTGDERFLKLCGDGSEPVRAYEFAHVFKQRYAVTDIRRNKQLLRDGTAAPYMQDFARLFIKYGKKYNRHDSHMAKYNNGVATFNIKIDKQDNITAFRLDPGAKPCIARIEMLKINGGDEYRLAGGNYQDCFQNVFTFFMDEPRIYFESREPVESIEIKLVVDEGTYAFAHAARFVAANTLKNRARRMLFRLFKSKK